jgi:hypothetical protein
MKKTCLIFAAASTVFLSACTHMPFSGTTAARPDPKNPNVYVLGKKPYIVVDQEPIVFLSGESGRIKWHLRTSDYEFDLKSGISGVRALPGTTANDVKDCRVDNKDQTEFSCQNDHSGPGTYKYDIVVRHKKSGTVYRYDPMIGND